MKHINHSCVALLRIPDLAVVPVFESWVIHDFAVSLMTFLMPQLRTYRYNSPILVVATLSISPIKWVMLVIIYATINPVGEI